MAKMKRVYHAVLEAQLAAIETVRPGVSPPPWTASRARCYEATAWTAPLCTPPPRLGLEIHEPRASASRQGRLEAGMAITIEPGVYLEGFGGIRIETRWW